MINKSTNNALLILGVILLLASVFMIKPFIGSLSLSIFFYYGCLPVYNNLRNRGYSKNISAILSELTLILPIIIIITYTIRVISIEIRILLLRFRSFVGTQNNALYNDLEQIPYVVNLLENYGSNDFSNLSDFVSYVQGLDLNYIISVADTSLGTILEIVSLLGDLLFVLFVAITVSFYLLKNKKFIQDLSYDVLNYNRESISFLEKLNKKLMFVFIGNLGLMVITSLISIVLYTSIMFLFPNGSMITYPVLISLLCGISSVIPVIGAKLSYIPVTVILYLNSILNYSQPIDLLLPTGFLILSFIFIDAIPDFIIRPRISSVGGTSVGIVLISFVFGPIVFGWYGLFLGPVILVTAHEFIKEILPKLSEGNI